MAASSSELPALNNLNSMIVVVHSVLSPYLVVRKYSSFPQLRSEANFIVRLRYIDRNIRNCTKGVP